MTVTAASLLALAFLVMVLLGYFSTVLVCSGGISNKLAWALAPAVGMGICSIIFFTFRRPMFTAEVLLLSVAFAAWFRYRRRAVTKVRLWNHPNRTWIAGLAGALAWVTFVSALWIDKAPHGGWDGWAIWNSHARYMYRTGPVWQQYIKNTAHPDYPLLVPAAAARLWRYMGNEVPEAPGVQDVLIAISGITVLAAVLWELRRNSVSFLMSLVLAGTPSYLWLAVWQYADVTLSVYILSTIGLISIHWERTPHNPRILALAGFTAGCAGWTKNEGLLFIVAALALLLVPILKERARTVRRLTMFSIGLFIPLAATLYFKVAVPWPNNIIQDQYFAELTGKILDVHRYTSISAAFLRTAGSFGGWVVHPAIPLIPFLVVWGINRAYVRNNGWITGAAILAVMLAGYFAVYVITALPLEYHLATSLDRVMMHLWPAMLLLAGLATDVSRNRIATEHGH